MGSGVFSIFGAVVKGVVKLSGCKGKLCEKIIKTGDGSVGFYTLMVFLVIIIFFNQLH